MYELKNTMQLIPNYVPLFQHQMSDLYASTTKNTQEIAQTQKTILDNGFRYTIFTEKPHTHTPFKTPITYSRLLTSHDLMFNPVLLIHTILPLAGTRFNVHVWISICFVKRVKPKSTMIYL